MLRQRAHCGFLATALLCVSGANAGTLGDNQRISSAQLGYDLQYRVYTPSGVSGNEALPTLYVTDGQWYLEHGGFKSILDQEIAAGRVRPLLVVFLDSRNPDDLSDDRRHEQFMCSTDFAAFFGDELLPTIDRTQPASRKREDRVILGFSFGALNSACFGLMLADRFAGVAMQSPASGQHVDVLCELYARAERRPLKLFLSAGSKNDNYSSARRFRNVLRDKGYDLTFVRVREGHDWRNWGSTLDDVLQTFFPEQINSLRK